MRRQTVTSRFPSVKYAAFFLAFSGAAAFFGQDPPEPIGRTPEMQRAKGIAGVISRGAVDQRSIRATIGALVSCGTRHSLSSWEDPKGGVGCGRDKILSRFNEIAKASKGRMQVVVDRFDASGPRTNDKPAHLENVLGILPGSDPALARTVFFVSGHFDSMPSSAMDASSDALG